MLEDNQNDKSGGVDMLWILPYFTYELNMFSEYFICTLESFQLYYWFRYSLKKSDVYGDFGDFLGVISFQLRGVGYIRKPQSIIPYTYRSIEKSEHRSIIHNLYRSTQSPLQPKKIRKIQILPKRSYYCILSLWASVRLYY